MFTTVLYTPIYAIEVWGSAFKTELDKILSYRKGLMTFNNAFPLNPGPLNHTDPIFIKLNFFEVVDIYGRVHINLYVFYILDMVTNVSRK